MYGENVGRTLQILAIVLFFITVFLSLLAGFIMMVNGNEGGLLVLPIGPVMGWFGTVMLYAFGTLVSNMQQANEKLERLEMLQRKVNQLSEDLTYLCDVKESEIKKIIRARQAVGTDE